MPPHGAPFVCRCQGPSVFTTPFLPVRFLHSSCHCQILFYLCFHLFPPQEWGPLSEPQFTQLDNGSSQCAEGRGSQAVKYQCLGPLHLTQSCRGMVGTWSDLQLPGHFRPQSPVRGQWAVGEPGWGRSQHQGSCPVSLQDGWGLQLPGWPVSPLSAHILIIPRRQSLYFPCTDL